MTLNQWQSHSSGNTVLASKAILVLTVITEYHRPFTFPESRNPTSRYCPGWCLRRIYFLVHRIPSSYVLTQKWRIAVLLTEHPSPFVRVLSWQPNFFPIAYVQTQSPWELHFNIGKLWGHNHSITISSLFRYRFVTLMEPRKDIFPTEAPTRQVVVRQPVNFLQKGLGPEVTHELFPQICWYSQEGLESQPICCH